MRSLLCRGLLVVFVAAPAWVQAQGTLLMDQVCGPDRLLVEGLPFQQELGQSFMPTLTGIEFVQFQAVVYPEGGSATSRVYLREGGPTGLLLGITDPLFITDSALAIRTFFFPQQIALTPGQTYYFGLEATFADPALRNMAASYLFAWPYDRGSLFINGSASPNADLWFREGVMVPEPDAWALLAIGLASWPLWRLRSHRNIGTHAGSRR